MICRKAHLHCCEDDRDICDGGHDRCQVPTKVAAVSMVPIGISPIAEATEVYDLVEAAEPQLAKPISLVDVPAVFLVEQLRDELYPLHPGDGFVNQVSLLCYMEIARVLYQGSI